MTKWWLRGAKGVEPVAFMEWWENLADRPLEEGPILVVVPPGDHWWVWPREGRAERAEWEDEKGA